MNGEVQNVIPYSVQKLYLPVRGCKLPCIIGGSVGPRMEICEISGLSIPMVPRLDQSNGYIKRRLRVWRAQKYNDLVGAENVHVSSRGSVLFFMPFFVACELIIPSVQHSGVAKTSLMLGHSMGTLRMYKLPREYRSF